MEIRVGDRRSKSWWDVTNRDRTSKVRTSRELHFKVLVTVARLPILPFDHTMGLVQLNLHYDHHV
jgi:hypothetical protein